MARPVFDLDLSRLAAVLYRPEDDVDTLLADFAADLLRAGTLVGGIVQRNLKDDSGRPTGMQVIDLMTGREISICQPLGSGSSACKLDPAGLAEASLAVTRAIAHEVALVIVNKFAKQEANGHGLRSELASAVVAGLPVLTAVPEKCLDAWTAFAAGRSTDLPCTRGEIDGWWRAISSRRVSGRREQLRGDRPRQPAIVGG
jgi:nucleoside-triphosphatase THEP1